jgi:hypothetical protein
MNKYVILCGKQYYIKSFEASSDCRHWVINHLDLSLNPSFWELERQDDNSITVNVRDNIGAYMACKRVFGAPLWAGNGLMAFNVNTF